MKTAKPMVRVLLVLLALAVIAGCASTRTQESSGQYVDSSVITAKVKAAIYDDPALKVYDINVETFKDVVQLSGFVNSAEVRNQATVVASRVSGVRSVKNDLIVKAK
jgi:osmotically-inducible protein OsmY